MSLTIVEVSSGCFVTSYAAGLLSELGFRVLKLEGAGGDSLRCDAIPADLEFATTVGAKEFVSVDGADGGDVAQILRLADVVLIGGIQETRPSIPDPRSPGVYVHVTPFGLTGPMSGWRASSFGLFHAAGLGSLTPRAPQRGTASIVKPAAPFGRVAEAFAGTACATLVAGLARGASGVDVAHDVEFSAMESLLPLVRRELAAVQYLDHDPSRHERLWKVAPSGIYEVADGHVYISVIEDHEWAALRELVDDPDLRDPKFADGGSRFEHLDQLDRILGPWLRHRSKEELFADCVQRGIPLAPVLSGAEVLELRQLAVRRFSVSDDGVGETEVVRRSMPFLVSGQPQDRHPWNPQVPAPLEVRASMDALEAAAGPSAAEPADALTSLQAPLRGTRVLEIGHVWAGPYCGQVLAALGAEVIRVESRARLDIHRRTGPFAPGSHQENLSGVWNAQNRGKRSLTLNLKHNVARQLALELVSKSDVVIENFRPGTLSRLGLGFDDLAEANPEILMLSLSGFGQDGPLSALPAYGPMMDAVSGISWATRLSERRPVSVNGWFPDVGAALFAALKCVSILTLHRNDRTARHVDVSELEAAVSLIADAVVADQYGFGDRVRAGNRLTGWAADCLPTADGPDSWVCLEFEAAGELRKSIEILRAVTSSDMSEVGGSDPIEDGWPELERLVKSLPQDVTVDTLQSNGIMAVPLLSARDLLNSSHLADRGAVVDVHRDGQS